MSEPIPESVPTSADPRSHRPIKRARVTNPALATQADTITALFADPSKPITLPPLSSTIKSTLPPPPEIVANVQGSSAGAGSGEFHVYKASRRREYERLRLMDEEARNEDDDAKWKREEEERRKRDEEKTRKNREKRERKKGRGKGDVNAKAGQSAGKENKNENGGDGLSATASKAVGGVKKGLQVPRRDAGDGDETSTDAGQAKAVEEIGIVIHDDD